MIYSVAKLLTFVTVFGVMLALTVYYFDIRLDLHKLEMTSNTSKCVNNHLMCMCILTCAALVNCTVNVTGMICLL